MRMMELLGKLSELHDRLDEKNLILFGRFVLTALQSPDPNAFIRQSLERALGIEDENAPVPTHVEVVSSDQGPRR